MDLVEHAGTLESEMSLTPSTEDEDEHGWLFLLEWDHETDPPTPYVGTTFDVSEYLGDKVTNRLAADRLLGKENTFGGDLAQHLRMLDLRIRFSTNHNASGPYLVKAQTPITADQLQDLIRLKYESDIGFKAFLKGAKF